MADQILMQRGPAFMHVPSHKVAAFLEDGWTVAAEQPAPAAISPEAADVAAPAASPDPEPIKRKGSKAKADN